MKSRRSPPICPNQARFFWEPSATETNFKQLPLSQYNVIHLALHGYVDPEFPDRSALVFAPQQQPTDDSLLQVREIRNLRLNASLVTLSACNTGVGPVGEEGVANIVNAFIEAGSQSVVSTLWELEDHATTHLMTVFYDHLGRHEEKAEALRQAQLEMLNSGVASVLLGGLCARRRTDRQSVPSARAAISLQGVPDDKINLPYAASSCPAFHSRPPHHSRQCAGRSGEAILSAGKAE